jgi:hypothetical protein
MKPTTRIKTHRTGTEQLVHMSGVPCASREYRLYRHLLCLHAYEVLRARLGSVVDGLCSGYTCIYQLTAWLVYVSLHKAAPAANWLGTAFAQMKSCTALQFCVPLETQQQCAEDAEAVNTSTCAHTVAWMSS